MDKLNITHLVLSGGGMRGVSHAGTPRVHCSCVEHPLTMPLLSRHLVPVVQSYKILRQICIVLYYRLNLVFM